MKKPILVEEVLHRVHQRTSQRVSHLNVAFVGNRVILEGIARSYHVKQLAQHGVLEVCPDQSIENKIRVQN